MFRSFVLESQRRPQRKREALTWGSPKNFQLQGLHCEPNQQRDADEMALVPISDLTELLERFFHGPLAVGEGVTNIRTKRAATDLSKPYWMPTGETKIARR